MTLKETTKLVLTYEEKYALQQAKDILDKIAEMMDRAVNIPWSDFDDDDIWGACEIIESFLK